MRTKEYTDNINFHKGNCKVCKSPNRKEIEELYLSWISPYDLEIRFPEVSKDSVYNHVRAFGLDKKRDADHDRLLGAIIDKGFRKGFRIGDSVMLKAVEMRMKKRGELTDKLEHSINNLSDAELDGIEQRIIDGVAKRITDAESSRVDTETPETE